MVVATHLTMLSWWRPPVLLSRMLLEGTSFMVPWYHDTEGTGNPAHHFMVNHHVILYYGHIIINYHYIM